MGKPQEVPVEVGRLTSTVDHIGRRAAGVEMLRSGASYDSIATALGYTDAEQAKRDTDRALVAEISKSRDEHKALALARLNGLLMAHWPAAKRGDGPATDRIIKIVAEQAKILGLYAPTRTEVVTIDQIEAEMSRLTAEMEAS